MYDRRIAVAVEEEEAGPTPRATEKATTRVADPAATGEGKKAVEDGRFWFLVQELLNFGVFFL